MPVAVDPLPRQPAAQAFAAAMFAAEHAPARAGDLGSDLSSAFPITALITSAPSPLPAPADARAPVLDLRGNEWIGEMIETIEQLRDAAGPASAGTTETRLRLAPDALGSVDVAIRQEGEQLSVRITAETQAARTILADAAPKLAELAEARGLKLGSSPTEHSSGGGLADRQPRQQQQSNQPTRPASAFRAEDAHASPALTRIA
jgi:flagellar hook-length control protein FliK